LVSGEKSCPDESALHPASSAPNIAKEKREEKASAMSGTRFYERARRFLPSPLHRMASSSGGTDETHIFVSRLRLRCSLGI
jgi:hypothetical protein